MTKNTKKVTKSTKPVTPKEDVQKISSHRQWLYNGDVAKLFEAGDVIPDGFKDK